jgi:hypothetical protein
LHINLICNIGCLFILDFVVFWGGLWSFIIIRFARVLKIYIILLCIEIIVILELYKNS